MEISTKKSGAREPRPPSVISIRLDSHRVRVLRVALVVIDVTVPLRTVRVVPPFAAPARAGLDARLAELILAVIPRDIAIQSRRVPPVHRAASAFASSVAN